MSAGGPTQGAERHAAEIDRWRSRPGLARTVRVAIVIAPVAISVFFTWVMGALLPPERLGLHRWGWIAMVFVAANLLLVGLSRLFRRLLPLVALMRLTLVFPDQAPSRTKTALRRSNSKAMLRRIQEAQARGESSDEITHGDYLVQLLKELNDHDRLTRGHSERVRAYAEMLGEELGFDDDDLDKLRWAALLHDVGKLSVPGEILNKDGRPTDEEWEVLAGHPAAARELLEPLRPWLGHWLHAADQHHCRWDGKGYPGNLAGEDISVAGRLVAIADAYDVMTSARSYKKPLSAELARQELTDCAGSQFDPAMVRAFLRIGLGRLQTVGGPLAWLANLTGSAQLPAPAFSALGGSVWTAGVAAVGVVSAAAAVAGPATPPRAEPGLAFVAPTITVDDVSVEGRAGDPIEVWLVANDAGTTPEFTVAQPAHGRVEGPLEVIEGTTSVWAARAVYTADGGYEGEDGFAYQACVPSGDCAMGRVRVVVVEPSSPPGPEPDRVTSTSLAPSSTPPSASTTTAPAPTTSTTPATSTPTTAGPVNGPPTPADDPVATAEDTPVIIDVTANDPDPDGDPISVSGVGSPLHGTTAMVSGEIRYTPDPDYHGPDQFTYTASDGIHPPVLATVYVTVSAVNDPPRATAPDASVAETASVGTAVLTVASSDVEGDTIGHTIVAGDPGNRFAIDPATGAVTLAAAVDHETTPSHALSIGVSDGVATTTVVATVTIVDVDELPVADDDSGATPEDTAVLLAVGANDADPEGGALTWNIPGLSTAGAALSESGGTVTYTPVADYVGTDTFVYTATDPGGRTSTPTTVTVTVTPVNDPPVANDDSGVGYTTAEDVAIVTDDVTVNDSDVDHSIDPASVALSSGASNGTAVANGDGTFTYTPDPDFVGTDAFTYTVTDGAAATSTPATVTITVTPVNDPPVANDDSGAGYSTAEDAPFTTADVTTNDTDLEDGPIDPTTATLQVDASNGTAVANGDGTFTYTPDPDWYGTDSFTYRVNDSGLLASNTATVTVIVTPVNDRPVAVGDSLTVGQGTAGTTVDVRLNDTDPEGDPLVVVGVTAGANGTAVHNGDGTITYTHDGSPTIADSFTYTVGDPGGQQDTATVTVTVLSAEDNDAVAAGSDNCPFLFNPDQADTDGDGTGDACDPSPTAASTGTFTDDGQDLGPDKGFGVALTDIDGDGDLDAVFANNGTANTVWRNDGTGTFTDTGQSLGSRQSMAIVAADLDGDGDVGLVVANGGGQANTIWSNSGTGTFFDSLQRLGSADSQDVAIGDIDSDGDLDLVFANAAEPNTVWLNNGFGVFSAGAQTMGDDKGAGVAMGDLDSDGDLDLVFADDGDDNSVWLNDGTGTFTDSGQLLGVGRGHDPALADLDGDGDLDIVFAEDNDGDTVWFNDGTGTFTDSGQNIGLGHSRALTLGDLDGDGDIDIVFGDHSGANSVWTNDGTGTFSDSGQRLDSSATEGITSGDVDGDGTLDVVTANDNDPNLVWLNS